MRIRFYSATLILCVAALVANAALGVIYFQQQRERESVITEFALAQEALAEYEGNTSDQEEQLAIAEGKLIEEQKAIDEARVLVEQAYTPDKLTSGGILSGILNLARDTKVNVVEISTHPEGEETIGNLVYSTLSIDLQAIGSLPHLAAFVSKLEKGAIKSVNLDKITIERTDESYVINLYFSVMYSRR